MAYEEGDVIRFRWRGSGQPAPVTEEIGTVKEVLYVAGKCPNTGRGRGHQDRLKINFVYDHPYPFPGWIYVHQVLERVGKSDG